MIAVILISAGVFALCAALRRRLSGSAPRFLFRDKIQLDPMYNRGAAFGLKLKGPVLNVLSAAALGVCALLPLGPAWGAAYPICMSACGAGACWTISAFPGCPAGSNSWYSTRPTLPSSPDCC